MRSPRGLDLATLLHFAPVVVDGHLQVGVSLQSVVEGVEITDSGAKSQPLAITIHAIRPQKQGRQQQLRNDGDNLTDVLGGENLSDAG